jgi:hypothetical protein
MMDQSRSDRGASIFMLAISLFLLIGASAIAVDIAAIWLDRSTDQKVTDAAAAVGILEAFQTGSQAACEAVLNYVAVNTTDLDSVDTSGCAAKFAGVCNDSLPLRELEVKEGRYDITVVYPVDGNDDLMTSRIVSRTPQALVEDDGEPCERLGVKMTSTRNSLFAQVLGFGEGTTTVHTVAMRIVGDDRPPLNLIVLDRTNCNAISVNGGGQIIATPVVDYDPDTGNPVGLVPGLIIADSDGSGCSGANGVINVSGGGSVIRSDGPPCDNGEPEYTFEGFTAQEGCGRIQVLAPAIGPGCSLKACSVSGGANEPKPAPTPLGSPYTRQPADHKYNCHADYTSPPDGTTWAADALTTGNQQNIKPCEDTAERDPYIYNLIDFVGPRSDGLPDSTFKYWRAEGNDCNPGGNITVNGNWVVDCNLQITSGKNVTINNGNVVFDRSVTVNGSLTINPPTDDPWIFFRGGTLTKGGNGTIVLNDAMVYMSKSSDVKLSGGAGPLTWTAPTTGVFANLALWSDSADAQSWSGQADLTLSGVFFMPRAIASYSGSGVQDQTDAQWLAWRLSVGGGAILKISPSQGALPALSDRSTLIR